MGGWSEWEKRNVSIYPCEIFRRQFRGWDITEILLILNQLPIISIDSADVKRGKSLGVSFFPGGAALLIPITKLAEIMFVTVLVTVLFRSVEHA